MHTLPLYYCCMTPYDAKFTGLHILFDKENVPNTIGEYVSKLGLSQLRIAETEKYAHVTFFLNGGREEKFEGEERILVASPKVATYDLQPEMSAPEVADKLVAALNEQKFDFICLNFANGDMVGHTGPRQRRQCRQCRRYAQHGALAESRAHCGRFRPREGCPQRHPGRRGAHCTETDGPGAACRHDRQGARRAEIRVVRHRAADCQ